MGENMSFKLFKLTTVVLASVTLSTAAVPLINISANADTVTVEPKTNTDKSSNDDIQVLDKYVSVVNNQFVLSIPISANVSNDLVAKAQEVVDKSNQSITKNHSVVNANTKTIMPNPIFASKAAWHSYYTYTNFWWGTRYYFTSNAAVNQLVNEFNNYAAALTVGAAVGGYFTVGTAALLGGLGAAYFTKVANDLNYYNSTHSQNQIYMDMNGAGAYDMHVLN